MSNERVSRAAPRALRKVYQRVPAIRSLLHRSQQRLHRSEQRRRRELMQHSGGSSRPHNQAVVVPDRQPDAGDVAIATRLLAAYREASRYGGSNRGHEDVWTDIAGRQVRFASILERGDAFELALYLCNVSRHDASEGITQGLGEFTRIMRDPSYRDVVVLMVKDKLVSLAEAVGALAVENPEQGPYGVNLHCDSGELVDRIAERIGIAITPPDIDGGLLKLETGRGLFNDRDANAIYTAWLMKGILGNGRRRICEIGGGSGRVAYWCHQLGLTSYTIIDLPHINVVQGYYLLKSLPGDSVLLYGESQPSETAGLLQILPAHAIAEIREPSFDAVLNQDSFPEIDREIVADYLRWMRTTCIGPLVSINQESSPPRRDGKPQLSVPEVVREVGGFTLEQRWPYWLRKGYIVELYGMSA